MKKTFIFACLLLFLVSCGDKRKQVVTAFEQVAFVKKSDMAFKILNIKDVRVFYGKDSAAIVKHEVDSLVRLYVEMEKITIRVDSSLLAKPAGNTGKGQEITEYKLQMERCQNAIDSLLKGYYTDPDLIRLENERKAFEAKSNEPLYNAVEVTYTMKDPFENFALQQVTKTYAFTPDNTKILCVLNEKFAPVK